MEDVNDPPRTRRTRFDVLPPNIVVCPPSTEIEDARKDESNATSSNPLLDAISKSLNLKTITTDTGESVTYASVVEKSFEERIQRALERNLRFVERKDAMAEQIIASGGNPLDPSLYPAELGGQKPSKFAKHMHMNRRVTAVKTGVGAAVPESAKPAKTETLSVYVSNLPRDISEEELDILFSAQGKIRRIKIYLDAMGQKKGDALITFCNGDAVLYAVAKLNKLDIGDGHVISVEKADFGEKSSTDEKKAEKKEEPSLCVDEAQVRFTKSQNDLRSVTAPTDTIIVSSATSAEIERLCALLHAETEVGKYPAVLIYNALDSMRAEQDEEYRNGVEMELLDKCRGFGVVKYTRTFEKEGVIAVVFEDIGVADLCARNIQGRIFDGCALSTHVLPSIIPLETYQQEPDVENEMKGAPQEDSTIEHERYQAEAESVEDFLNSLL